MSATAKRWWGKARQWQRRLRMPQSVPRVAVLMYHRIAEPGNDPWKMCVSPQHFREHMAVLQRHCEVIGLTSLRGRLDQPRTRPLVVITFDDGYRDNLDIALPILENAGLSATLFLATDAVDSPEPFWWDVLADLVAQAQLPTCLELEVGGERFIWEQTEGRDELRSRLWERLSGLDVSDIRCLIQQLCAWAGHEPHHDPLRLPLSTEEVGQLLQSGLVSLGCHSASHLRMTVRAATTCEEDLSRSRDWLRSFVGSSPSVFAYPYGEYDQASTEQVRMAGYELACTSDAGLATQDSNPLALPRLGVGNWTGAYFDAWLRHYWRA